MGAQGDGTWGKTYLLRRLPCWRRPQMCPLALRSTDRQPPLSLWLMSGAQVEPQCEMAAPELPQSCLARVFRGAPGR